MDTITIVVTAGLILDFIFGDPAFLYHPIRIIGNVIHFLDERLRKEYKATKQTQNVAGGLLVFAVLLFTFLLFGGIYDIANAISFYLGVAVEIIFCYQIFSAKSLKTESMKVYTALQEKDIEKARKAVSMIVGRDTQSLTEEGIIKAAVETVAENTSDGVIAPLFYMTIGGPVLGFLYKAVNTMDSMVGYKNETYRYFGTAAAKLDDFLNFIPARLSAGCMIISAGICHRDRKEAYRIFLRDRNNHESPNSAQTEAVMAGALHIQLAGDAYYFGELHKKLFIGDATRPIEVEDIKKANQLMYATTILSALIFLGIRLLVVAGIQLLII